MPGALKQYRLICTVGRTSDDVQQEMNNAAAEGYVWEGKEMTFVRQAHGSHYQSGASTETWSIVMERDLPVDSPALEREP